MNIISIITNTYNLFVTICLLQFVCNEHPLIFLAKSTIFATLFATQSVCCYAQSIGKIALAPIMDHLVLRNGNWSLRRRVPVVFADVETRREVWISLHTDFRNVARSKAEQVWQEMVAHWQALLDGKAKMRSCVILQPQGLPHKKGFYMCRKRIC